MLIYNYFRNASSSQYSENNVLHKSSRMETRLIRKGMNQCLNTADTETAVLRVREIDWILLGAELREGIASVYAAGRYASE